MVVWQTGLGALLGIAVVYGVLLGLLWRWARRHPDAVGKSDALRLVPDLVRLIRRLAADATLGIGLRVRLVLLLVYLASPIDLVPDFVPVIGYADDAVIVCGGTAFGGPQSWSGRGSQPLARDAHGTASCGAARRHR